MKTPDWSEIEKKAQHVPIINAVINLGRVRGFNREQMLIVMVRALSAQLAELQDVERLALHCRPPPGIISDPAAP